MSTELKFVLSFLAIAVFEMFSILEFSLPYTASVNKQAYQRSITTWEEGKNHHNILNLFLLVLQRSLEDRFGEDFLGLGWIF